MVCGCWKLVQLDFIPRSLEAAGSNMHERIDEGRFCEIGDNK